MKSIELDLLNWSVTALLDDPENIITFEPCQIIVTLRVMLANGYIEQCVNTIKHIPYRDLDINRILTKSYDVKLLIDEMVRQGEVVRELVCMTFGWSGAMEYLVDNYPNILNKEDYPSQVQVDKYWMKMIQHGISKSDCLRTWEVIKKSSHGIGLSYFCSNKTTISLSQLKIAVDGLYELLIIKRRLKSVSLIPGGIPEINQHHIRETKRAKLDRFDRRRKPREYEHTYPAPGLRIARKFADYPPSGGRIINRTGQKVLVIARYFASRK
jgi:hypothetical protein